ncbi:hypothetical protein CY35_11G000600 [Sphagnum magellanicum]|nr:hypothetical protein CY35_11G000600 [Sphagnum magellanicum]
MALTFNAVFVLLVSALALCQASSDPDPVTVKILEGLKDVTTQSKNLRIEVEKITIDNAGKNGVIIVEGLTSITAKIVKLTTKLDSPPLPKHDAKLILEALTKFVKVQEELLQEVISKHGLRTLVPFFERIRLALVEQEAAINTFASKLIRLIPSEKEPANEQFHSLLVTLRAAITTYSQRFLALADPEPEPLTVKILEALKNVTTQSKNLRIEVERITIDNAGKKGVIIVEGLNSITAKVVKLTTKLDSPPLPKHDAKLILEALTKFVQVQEQLLQEVIRKHGLRTLVPFFERIRLALVEQEAAINTFASKLIRLIPSEKQPANEQFHFLLVTLRAAITTYSQRFLALADPEPEPLTVKILKGLKNVTTQSKNLRIEVERITIDNAGKKGGIIVEGLNSITAKIVKLTTKLDSPPPLTHSLPKHDAKLIVEALTKFVHVHEELLQEVIRKHELLTLVPFFERIRLALVEQEAAINTFASKLIRLIPSEKQPANEQFHFLLVTLRAAITTYSQRFLALADPEPEPLTVKILKGLKNVTTQSKNLRIEVERITIDNAGKKGGIIVEGLNSITAKIVKLTTKLDSPPPLTHSLPKHDAKLIVEALTKFVHVHKELLQEVIRKHELLTLVPFFERIRLALVEQEAAIDTFASKLIHLIPSEKEPANEQFHSLLVTLRAAITTYSQPFVALADEEPLTVKILEGFDDVTTQSKNLRIEVETITIVNAGEKGVIIVEGLNSITAKIVEGTTKLDSPPLPKHDAKLIVEALTKFVHVHEELLQEVIRKHGLRTLVPFFERIRLAVVHQEAAIDTFASKLIHLIPSQKEAADEQFASLLVTLRAAITTYSPTPQASQVAQY